MRTCPNRHPADDHLEYCEDCGSRIDGAPDFEPVSPAPQVWTCARCGTDQGAGRYCEACGEPNSQHPDFAPGTAAAPTSAPAAAPPVTEAAPAPNGAAPPPAGPAITLVAIADRVFFDRMQSHNGPDAASLTFPAVYPPRTFTLDGPQIFIGRRSRSRGIEPDIDLSAAPEDSGVSHAHAAIISEPAGWCLVDVGSSNGTYLNAGPDPIPANTPTRLNDGDRIHLGAWTTLTVRL